MFVCLCNGVTDQAIRQAAADGVRSLSELTRRTGCAGNCGSCAEMAEQLLHEARRARPFSLGIVVAQAA